MAETQVNHHWKILHGSRCKQYDNQIQPCADEWRTQPPRWSQKLHRNHFWYIWSPCNTGNCGIPEQQCPLLRLIEIRNKQRQAQESNNSDPKSRRFRNGNTCNQRWHILVNSWNHKNLNEILFNWKQEFKSNSNCWIDFEIAYILFDKSAHCAYSNIHPGTEERFAMANSIEQLDRLEKRVSELIDHCQSLREENTRLKREFAASDAQCTELLTKNENASKQVREAVETLQQISTSGWVNPWTTQMKAQHQAWRSI